MSDCFDWHGSAVRSTRGHGRRSPGVLSLPLILASALLLQAHPGASGSYRVGDRLDPQTQVLDASMQPVPLLQRVRAESRLVVLIIFGGAARRIPPAPFRGSLWCEDSFDDLAVQRALLKSFEGSPVQFIGVAVPPVYSPAVYGYEQGAFLDPDPLSGSPQVQAFIEATEKEVKSGLLPYPEIYYDPAFRLGRETADAWSGKLKWHRDSRQYGTPTIWILGPRGEIVREPFFGNDYDAAPPRISYGYQELHQAVEEALLAADGGEHTASPE